MVKMKLPSSGTIKYLSFLAIVTKYDEYCFWKAVVIQVVKKISLTFYGAVTVQLEERRERWANKYEEYQNEQDIVDLLSISAFKCEKFAWTNPKRRAGSESGRSEER